MPVLVADARAPAVCTVSGMTPPSTRWMLRLLDRMRERGQVPATLTLYALTDPALREDRDLALAVVAVPDLPAAVRAHLAGDGRAFVRAAFLGRSDVTSAEAAALLEGETRGSVLNAAFVHGWTRTPAPSSTSRRKVAARPAAAVVEAPAATRLEKILDTAPASAYGDVPAAVWPLLADHPDLTLTAARAIDANQGRFGRPDLRPMLAGDAAAACLEVDALASVASLAGAVLSLEPSTPDHMQRVRAAADLVAGRGMYPLGMWVERVLDAMTTHDAEHPDHMDAIAWPAHAADLFRELLSAEPGLVTAFCHNRANEHLTVLFDGWDGTGPNAGWWPAPGTARHAWLSSAGAAEFDDDFVACVPTPVLRDLLSVVPDAVLDAVAYSPTAERVAEVLPDVLASWTRDEPGWDTLLAALDVAPAGDARMFAVAKAVLAAPGFDVARVADCALFASLVPEDPAAAAAWSSGQVLRAAADMPAVSAHVAASLDALTADQVAVFVTLAPDWPGTWGELLRAAELTTAS